jgi:hypothetical protein
MRRALRSIRVRSPSLDRAGQKPVRIDDLISPLRYDILVREQFFNFLAQHDASNQRNLVELTELSTKEPYFEWFRSVMVPNILPAIAGHADQIREAFGERVRSAVELHRSFHLSGYDRRRPIILRTGRVLEPSVTGKRLARSIHAGDGCHRLALLRSTGVTVLEPEMYRLDTARRLVPRDNTLPLLEALELDPRDYFLFLSLSYAPGRNLCDKRALLEHVRVHDADKLTEVHQIIAIDEPLLTADSRTVT